MTEENLKILTGAIQRSLRNGETGMSDGECNRAGYHVARDIQKTVESLIAENSDA